MKDDFNDLENINIEEGNIAENNDETSPDSLLKILYHETLNFLLVKFF